MAFRLIRKPLTSNDSHFKPELPKILNKFMHFYLGFPDCKELRWIRLPFAKIRQCKKATPEGGGL